MPACGSLVVLSSHDQVSAQGYCRYVLKVIMCSVHAHFNIHSTKNTFSEGGEGWRWEEGKLGGEEGEVVGVRSEGCVVGGGTWCCWEVERRG